jgi:hypothetical protein
MKLWCCIRVGGRATDLAASSGLVGQSARVHFCGSAILALLLPPPGVTLLAMEGPSAVIAWHCQWQQPIVRWTVQLGLTTSVARLVHSTGKDSVQGIQFIVSRSISVSGPRQGCSWQE